MYTKIWVMSVMLVGLLSSVWISTSRAEEGTSLSRGREHHCGSSSQSGVKFLFGYVLRNSQHPLA